MSNSLNKVQLIGNMTADAEIKQTPSGVSVATFSLATNKKWKTEDGKMEESVEFHSCVAWRWLAEIMEKFTEKGKKLYVEGELKTRSWEKDGVKFYKTEVIANNVILITGGNSWVSRDDEPPARSSSSSAKSPKPGHTKPRNGYGEEEIAIEDIPF